MSEQREIIKASWLQHVVHKKGGTLHRKAVNFNLIFLTHSYKESLLHYAGCCLYFRKFYMKKGSGSYYVFTVVVYHFWNGTSQKNMCMDIGILSRKVN